MKQHQGFDEPNILTNDVKTLRRVIGQLTDNMNILLNRINSGKFKGDIYVDGDAYVQDLIMSAESLYLGRKQEDRRVSFIDGFVRVHGRFQGRTAKIGNVVDGNYFEVESDGTVKFNGDAVVWDDLQVPISSIRLGGVAPADEVAYKGGIVLSFDDGSDEYVYFVAQIPHSYNEGSDLDFHLHWTPKVSGSGSGAENVKWDLTYSWINIGGSFPAESSATVTIDVQDDSADDHKIDDVVTLSGSGKKVSSILICSLKRDTAVANNYADEAYVIAIDFHFEKDTVGSRLELTK